MRRWPKILSKHNTRGVSRNIATPTKFIAKLSKIKLMFEMSDCVSHEETASSPCVVRILPMSVTDGRYISFAILRVQGTLVWFSVVHIQPSCFIVCLPVRTKLPSFLDSFSCLPRPATLFFYFEKLVSQPVCLCVVCLGPLHAKLSLKASSTFTTDKWVL